MQYTPLCAMQHCTCNAIALVSAVQPNNQPPNGAIARIDLSFQAEVVCGTLNSLQLKWTVVGHFLCVLCSVVWCLFFVWASTNLYVSAGRMWAHGAMASQIIGQYRARYGEIRFASVVCNQHLATAILQYLYVCEETHLWPQNLMLN